MAIQGSWKPSLANCPDCLEVLESRTFAMSFYEDGRPNWDDAVEYHFCPTCEVRWIPEQVSQEEIALMDIYRRGEAALDA